MTQLVGILNVTPDSFSDGGLFEDPDAAARQAARLFEEGAAMVDIGAESTRPGAKPLTPAEEWARLSPVLQRLEERFEGKLLVDTYHPETAAQVLNGGDFIINDITGMSDPKMVELITTEKARCIVSHLPAATPGAAHAGQLVDDVRIVVNDLLERARTLQKKGLPAEHIILDPGIGFGKTEQLNWKLLEFAREVPAYPVMIGYSRKRFLGDRRMELETNLAAGRKAVAAGAAYLRVHDIAGHRQLI